MDAAPAPLPLVGVTMCLGASALWAVSVTLFREPISAFGARTINLAKCIVAAILQLVTVGALGLLGPLTTAPLHDVALVACSGLVGLTLGDTALFASVARIGVHRTLLLQTLAPVFAAVLAAAWRGERPTVPQALGALVILVGVALVVAPPPRARRAVPAAGPALGAGILLGLLAAAGQGSGIVLAKAGMDSIPVLPASVLRLAAAAVGLILLGAASGRLGRLAALARSPLAPRRVLPAIAAGTYVALFLMMGGIALAPAAVAAVLLSTSPVFSLLIESVVDRRPVSPRALAGTLLAVAGVALLSTA